MAQSLAAKLRVAEAALADVRNAIAGNRGSPEVRAIRVKLETYERVLQGVRYRTPAEEQYRSFHDCVLELHEQVFGKGKVIASSQSKSPEPRPSKRPTAKPRSTSTGGRH
jgi:hypothetical protein